MKEMNNNKETMLLGFCGRPYNTFFYYGLHCGRAFFAEICNKTHTYTYTHTIHVLSSTPWHGTFLADNASLNFYICPHYSNATIFTNMSFVVVIEVVCCCFCCCLCGITGYETHYVVWLILLLLAFLLPWPRHISPL